MVSLRLAYVSLWVTIGVLCELPACGGSDNSSGLPPPSGTGTGGVVPCSSDGQCAPPLPYCDMGGGVCVACLADPNCVDTGRPHCDPASHACVQCLDNSQCGGDVPYCSPTTLRCVQCVAAGNCASGQTCDTAGGTCVAVCGSNADCSAFTGRPYCDPVRQFCVQCLGDGNCTADAPYCNPATARCVQCLTGANCTSTGDRPYCNPAHNECVQCLTDANCGGGQRCDPGELTCGG